MKHNLEDAGPRAEEEQAQKKLETEEDNRCCFGMVCQSFPRHTLVEEMQEAILCVPVLLFGLSPRYRLLVLVARLLKATTFLTCRFL